MTRTERLLRLARLRGDRAAELIMSREPRKPDTCPPVPHWHKWTEAELRAAWGDR